MKFVGKRLRPERYDRRIIALHWTTAALVAFVVAIGLGHDLVASREARRAVMDVHRLLGLTILAVIAARGILRLRTEAPHHGLGRIQALGASAAHFVFYGLLITLPLLGLAHAGAAKAHPTLFGVIPLPSLVTHDRELARTLADWHGQIAWALIALVGLHAAAALWHHYIRRDNVLRAMWPTILRPAGGSVHGTPATGETPQQRRRAAGGASRAPRG